MPLCEIVVALADAIAEQRPFLTPEEACLLHVVRGIPYYRDIRRLDAWEEACNKVTPDNLTSTETGELLEEVLMLGECNLFQAFEPNRTREFYERLVPFFASRGVTIPTNPDLSDW
ncbi:hypothetical protein [Aeoliella sp.]|uniref:hypothetical protein n=1 Tax=Aeoliella sp. TaxID=2795800 RepID=UPI003CCC3747